MSRRADKRIPRWVVRIGARHRGTERVADESPGAQRPSLSWAAQWVSLWSELQVRKGCRLRDRFCASLFSCIIVVFARPDDTVVFRLSPKTRCGTLLQVSRSTDSSHMLPGGLPAGSRAKSETGNKRISSFGESDGQVPWLSGQIRQKLMLILLAHVGNCHSQGMQSYAWCSVLSQTVKDIGTSLISRDIPTNPATRSVAACTWRSTLAMLVLLLLMFPALESVCTGAVQGACLPPWLEAAIATTRWKSRVELAATRVVPANVCMSVTPSVGLSRCITALTRLRGGSGAASGGWGGAGNYRRQRGWKAVQDNSAKLKELEVAGGNVGLGCRVQGVVCRIHGLGLRA